MVVLSCPIEGCTYATGDIEATRAITLFTVHGYSLAPDACQQAKPEKLSRPKVSKESTSEDWEYFITRWDANKKVTRTVDHDATLKLLECCEKLSTQGSPPLPLKHRHGNRERCSGCNQDSSREG